MNNKHILNALSNLQINKILGSYPKYRGCFSCLQLPKSQNGFYVINIDEHHNGHGLGPPGGSHWVSAWITPNIAYYIDSFGQIPNSPITQWLINSGRKIKYNTVDLQAYKSDACGYFACYIGEHLMSGFSVDKTLDLFKTPSENQQILKKFFF